MLQARSTRKLWMSTWSCARCGRRTSSRPLTYVSISPISGQESSRGAQTLCLGTALRFLVQDYQDVEVKRIELVRAVLENYLNSETNLRDKTVEVQGAREQHE